VLPLTRPSCAPRQSPGSSWPSKPRRSAASEGVDLDALSRPRPREARPARRASSLPFLTREPPLPVRALVAAGANGFPARKMSLGATRDRHRAGSSAVCKACKHLPELRDGFATACAALPSKLESRLRRVQALMRRSGHGLHALPAARQRPRSSFHTPSGAGNARAPRRRARNRRHVGALSRGPALPPSP
jgi:hypothetical protein